jgi:nucleoside-diphosphate-sugar epimerase
MSKFWVTGSAGFIGFEVCKQLARLGHSVTALDGLVEGLYGREEKVKRWNNLGIFDNVERIKIDFSKDSFSKLSKLSDPEYIINLAAMPGLKASWEIFSSYVDSNITSTHRLAEWFSTKKIKKFIHISTSSVYGKFATGDETSNLNPISPYGVTKLAAEGILNSYNESYGLPVVTLRYFSVYGPGQRPDMAYRKFIDCALRGQPLKVYGDGSQIRTNSFVLDVARWTINSAEFGEVANTYNLSGSQPISILGAIEILEKILNRKLSIEYEDRPMGDQSETRGVIGKARDAQIWDYETDLEIGLQSQVNWQRNKSGDQP